MDPARRQQASSRARQLLNRLQGHRSGKLFDLSHRQRERAARKILHIDSPESLLGGDSIAWADDLSQEQPATAAALYALEHDHLVDSSASHRSAGGKLCAGLRFQLACALMGEGSKTLLRLAVEVFHSTLDGCAVHSTSALQFHCWQNLGYALSALGDPLASAYAFQNSRTFAPSAETCAAVQVLAAEALDQGGDLPAAQRLVRSSWRDLHGLSKTPEGREILARWSPYLSISED